MLKGLVSRLVNGPRSELHELAEQLPELHGYCGHRPTRKIIRILFGGLDGWYRAATPWCEPCTVRFLKEFSGICGICGQAILPLVAVAGCLANKPDRPYVHLRCTPQKEFWLGSWGLRDIIPIDNLEDYIRMRRARGAT